MTNKSPKSDLSFLVEETMSLVSPANTLKKTDQRFVSIYFHDYKEGFYTLTNEGVEMDLPKTMDIFQTPGVFDIGEVDEILNNAICEFLKIDGSYKIVHSDQGPYLLCAREDIKKAA